MADFKMDFLYNFSLASLPNIHMGSNTLNKLPDLIKKYASSSEKQDYSRYENNEGDKAKKFSANIVLVIGKHSLEKSGNLKKVLALLKEASIWYSEVRIGSEPSPEIVDNAAKEFCSKNIDVVVAIGGGSVLDAGKAISAMIPVFKDYYNAKSNNKDSNNKDSNIKDSNIKDSNNEDSNNKANFTKDFPSVKDFLEGVGTKKPDGRKIPFIAIPTTSGTGSEATKNAVISKIATDNGNDSSNNSSPAGIGKNCFKKSLRHDNYVPNEAIVDPRLMVSCPLDITASCGLDALTQLIGAYVSTKAGMITDKIALSGMQSLISALPAVMKLDDNDKGTKKEEFLRLKIAYGALASGIALANAGLGIVHGFASPLGAVSKIPHGVACGTMLAIAFKKNIIKLKELEKDSGDFSNMGLNQTPEYFLQKFAEIGAVFENPDFPNIKKYDKDERERYLSICTDTLESWIDEFKIGKLGQYGIDKSLLKEIAINTGIKNNPVSYTKTELIEMLTDRL